MTTTIPKRATCATCLRAQSACICGCVVPVASPIELLILQHPLEVANAKNSARLLHLCLAGSTMEAGQSFDPSPLDALLHAGGRKPVLLYPETPTDAGMVAPQLLDASLLADPSRVRLVLLDATWRKSRKMLYLNPALQRLPRLALQDMPEAAYGVLRKAHAPDQLSTLEAAAYALAQLGDGEAAKALLGAFDGFVRQQMARRPPLS